MSSSYDTPCSKHKLVVSIYSNTETSLAKSSLAISAPRCNVRGILPRPLAGATENAGVENAIRSKIQRWKMREHTSRMES